MFLHVCVCEKNGDNLTVSDQSYASGVRLWIIQGFMQVNLG